MRTVAVGTLLELAEDASPVEAVASVARELRDAMGANAVSILVPDASRRALVRLAHVTDEEDEPRPDEAAEPATRIDDEESAATLPLTGGVAEAALRTQTLQVLPPGVSQDGEPASRQWTVYAPVTERGEVHGLLELSLPSEPTEDMRASIAATAHVLAFVVIANRRHTDLFEWGQRTVAFTLPAEIQRRLLPPANTCEAGAFTLSGWLEPAATAEGDTFDYSLGRDALHLSLTDAMGHDLASSLTATLCVGSLRNSRRAGASLAEQAATANAVLHDHLAQSGGEGFVTGTLAYLDLRTGTLDLLNAGHVAPFLCRGGVVRALEPPVDLPFGMFADSTYRTTKMELEQGDRLVFVSDGMLRRDKTSTLDAEILASMALHPREATRCLADHVLEVFGPQLQDDATVMILDWRGHHERSRRSRAGSNLPRD